MEQKLPEWARKIFERKLKAVLGYYTELKKAQILEGKSFRRSVFIEIYAPTQGTTKKNLHRWIKDHREDGEEGLIPGYGKTKGRTIIGSRLSHLIAPLIATDKKPMEIVREFRVVCLDVGETPPCKETILKYIKRMRGNGNVLLEPPKQETREELKARIIQLQLENAALSNEIKRLKDALNK